MKAGGRLAIALRHFIKSKNISASSVTRGMATVKWQLIIEDALEEDKTANVYQLASIDNTSASAGAVPRVRTVVHRSFLSARSSEDPLLLTTTDIRTAKATQFAQNTHVELAWWHPKPQSQFRISGTVYVYASPDFALSGADSVPEERKKHIEETAQKLRSSFPGKELGEEVFDWEKERIARFNAMSGHMRASWVRPVPGRLEDPNEAKKWPETLPTLEEAGSDQKPLVEAALRNFALVLIDPKEVDYVELGVIPNRRTRFYKDGKQWKEEPLVP